MTSTLTTPILDLTGERPRRLLNYVAGEWVEGSGRFTPLHHAVTGAPVAEASSEGVDFARMVEYARKVGGPALRKMTFHERALMLKAMAQYLTARKDDFYAISAATGATKVDSWIDIDGGIGTSSCTRPRGVASCLTRRSMSTGQRSHSRRAARSLDGTCVSARGRRRPHQCLRFPVWGMMEKLAPTLFAACRPIVKPATVTRRLHGSRVSRDDRVAHLPRGAIQLICGSAGDLLDHLDAQCAVAFTGSADHRAHVAREAIHPRSEYPLQHRSRFSQLLDARARRHSGERGVRSLRQRGRRAR